jgi:hypothetical protein
LSEITADTVAIVSACSGPWQAVTAGFTVTVNGHDETVAAVDAALRGVRAADQDEPELVHPGRR